MMLFFFLSGGGSPLPPPNALKSQTAFLHSDRGQSSRDLHHPRERPAHLLWLHPGCHHLGFKHTPPLQTDPDRILLLPASTNHPGRRLFHAKQTVLPKHWNHSGLRRHRDLVEYCQFGVHPVGLSEGRSHGYADVSRSSLGMKHCRANQFPIHLNK